MAAMIKVVTVVGARPQFVKAGPMSAALRLAGHREVLVHTGQHYDHGMSKVFFDELGIPEPAQNLEVGSGSHGAQTGQMLERLERVLQAERPDWVLVFGDTNSTLAGALAAAKLGIPVAHVEAGLRSWNRAMPEEHNRVLTDHCADLLLCPTTTAVANLRHEGLTRGVKLVGDPMYDAVLAHLPAARARQALLASLGVTPRGYVLATVHRPYNTDDPAKLRALLAGLVALAEPVVFPVHPRTRKAIAALGVDLSGGQLRLIEPVGYLDMLALEAGARLVMTDSGGVQKEAYFLGVPCLTLRPETEWVETVEAGWNLLVATEPAAMVEAARRFAPQGEPPRLFGDGHACERIAETLTHA
jgi:UDP-N-acetylglucosamine 2-epimerase